jgi:hypothetical protein
VDELELGWESEWQQAAIIDWELEYSDRTQLKNGKLLRYEAKVEDK